MANHGRIEGRRVATVADHQPAVAFDLAATDSDEAFLERFLAELIERGELGLCEKQGEIIATGERRVDRRTAGHAHLGLIVARDHRRQGLGSRLMHALVEQCRSQNLVPLCSTESDNLAAQRAIRSAGFVSRHSVFRVEFGDRS